jgi:integrase
MARQRITKKLLENLGNDTGKDVFYRDSELPGFGIKVTPIGRISFIAEGRIKGGKSKRVTLGHFPVLKLDEAREEARASLLTMSKGDDPVELAREAREDKSRALAKQEALSVTLETVFKDFLKARSHKPGTRKDYENTMENCFSDWLKQPVRSITRKDVENRFYKIKEGVKSSSATDGKAQAAKAMRVLSAVLNHAKGDEIDGERLIIENPCDVLKDKRVDRRIKPRKRYLEKEELKSVAEELSHVHHPSYRKQKKRITNPSIADYLVLLLFTGLRRNEAASLEWRNVDMDNEFFTIEDTKNHETHIVPMSPPVRAMFEHRIGDEKKHEKWVFPAKRGDSHLIEPRKQIERIAEITGVKFTSHDLRRTFATVAESYGLDYQTIKRTLNHKSQDITERYIQTRADKMRHAFNAIAEEIQLWAFDIPPASKLTPEEQKEVDGDPPDQDT